MFITKSHQCHAKKIFRLARRTSPAIISCHMNFPSVFFSYTINNKLPRSKLWISAFAGMTKPQQVAED
jgi:hypothetical protein